MDKTVIIILLITRSIAYNMPGDLNVPASITSSDALTDQQRQIHFKPVFSKCSG